MNREEIEVMMSLIESHYPRISRNTPEKMSNLIKKEFNVDVSHATILRICGIQEDFETENRKIENGYYGTDYY